jgi:hypothetical protein
MIYCDNGSPFVNMKLRMAADRQGIKMELGPDLSSFLYWFARTCRPPGKETNPKVGSGKGGTLVRSLAPGSTRGHDQPQQQIHREHWCITGYGDVGMAVVR